MAKNAVYTQDLRMYTDWEQQKLRAIRSSWLIGSKLNRLLIFCLHIWHVGPERTHDELRRGLEVKRDFVFTLCETEEEKRFQRTEIKSDHQTGNFELVCWLRPVILLIWADVFVTALNHIFIFHSFIRIHLWCYIDCLILLQVFRVSTKIVSSWLIITKSYLSSNKWKLFSR